MRWKDGMSRMDWNCVKTCVCVFIASAMTAFSETKTVGTVDDCSTGGAIFNTEWFPHWVYSMICRFEP